MISYIVDTHALVWFLEKNPKLGGTAKSALSDTDAQIIIPTIVLDEISFLCAKKKIKVDVFSVLSKAVSSENCIVYPLDEEIVSRIPTTLDIHDAIVVATGLLYRDLMGHNATVITKDEAIKNANVISTIW